MRPTSIMRYFHLATVALTLWKLHVQDLLGSKLTTSSVYTLLPRPCEYPLSPTLLDLSLSFFLPFFHLILTISITYPLQPFSVTTSSSFYLSSSLRLFLSVSFNHSLSLSPLTPDDSSYCRTTPQAPHIRSHAMG